MNPADFGLPHREPFVFVDEILEIENGKSARGVKTFDGGEAFFAGHFPGDPIVPGVLLAEALAQVAGVAGGGPCRRFLLSAVQAMKFPRAVRPGERIELLATRAGGLGGLLMFETTARVGGEVVAEGRIVLSESP